MSHAQNIIVQGCQLLQNRGYGQINILNKLTLLGNKFSTALLSKVLNGKGASHTTLIKLSNAISALVFKELGLSYSESDAQFSISPPPDWHAEIVPETTQEHHILTQTKFHWEGRVPVQYKTAFFANAALEVLEIGVRLNTFAHYFTSQNETIYKNHIIALLERGVHVKAYLIDPDSNEARLYFGDRSKTQKSEKDGTEDVKRIIEKLVGVCNDINALGHPGKFQIFKYKHFPYANFYVVDGALPTGKMLVSHYIYGVKRADCPVLELSKTSNPVLYRRYWESVQQYIEGAVSIVP